MSVSTVKVLTKGVVSFARQRLPDTNDPSPADGCILAKYSDTLGVPPAGVPGLGVVGQVMSHCALLLLLLIMLFVRGTGEEVEPAE